MTFVEPAVGLFGVVERGGKDFAGDAALRVLKEGTQRNLRGEAPIHGPNHGGEVGTGEGGGEIGGKGGEGFRRGKPSHAGVNVLVSEMENGVAKALRFLGDARVNCGAPGGQTDLAAFRFAGFLAEDVVAVDGGAVRQTLEHGIYGEVSAHLFEAGHGGHHQGAINGRAVALRRDVAFCGRQSLQEVGFERIAEQLLRQLNGASGVLKNLDGLDAGDVVEEPSATGVHQHQVALHLQKLPRFHGLSVR